MSSTSPSLPMSDSFLSSVDLTLNVFLIHPLDLMSFVTVFCLGICYLSSPPFLWLPKGFSGSLVSAVLIHLPQVNPREFAAVLIFSCLLNIYLCLLIVFLVWLCPTPLASSLTSSSLSTHSETVWKPSFLSTMTLLCIAYAISFDWTTLPFFICLLHSDSFFNTLSVTSFWKRFPVLSCASFEVFFCFSLTPYTCIHYGTYHTVNYNYLLVILVFLPHLSEGPLRIRTVFCSTLIHSD